MMMANVQWVTDGAHCCLNGVMKCDLSEEYAMLHVKQPFQVVNTHYAPELKVCATTLFTSPDNFPAHLP